MKCPTCEKEILNDGKVIMKSFAGGLINYVHSNCHYQHLLNFSTDKYMEYEDLEMEIGAK